VFMDLLLYYCCQIAAPPAYYSYYSRGAAQDRILCTGRIEVS
jgi:hypothetical protein